MAKKRTLEEFFQAPKSDTVIPYRPGEENWMEDFTPKRNVQLGGGKAVTVDKSGVAVTKQDSSGNKKQVTEMQPIGVDTPIEEPTVEAPPAPPVVDAPKAPNPSGDRVYASPQVAGAQQTSLKQTLFGEPQPDASAWERALIGATPLLVGLLTGNKLEGVQTSANYFTKEEGDRYKRTKDMNQKLEELKMKRDLATTTGKLNAKTFEYRGSDGINRIGRFINGQQFLDEKNDPLAPIDAKSAKPNYKNILNEKTGRYEVAEIMPGGQPRFLGKAEEKFAPKYDFVDLANEATKDPYDAKKNLYINGKLDSTLGDLPLKPQLQKEDGKNDRFREAQINNVVKGVTSRTSTFNMAKESALAIVKAADLINKPNAFSDEGVKTFLARSVFDEKGPLSDFDLARLAGEGSIDAVAVRNIQRWRDGQRITDGDAIAMRQVLEAVYPYIQRKAMGEIENTIAAYPAYAEDLRGRLRGYSQGFPALPAWSNPKRDGVDVKKSVEKTRSTQIPEGFAKFKGPKGETATVPLSDKEALKEARELGWQEIK